MAKHASYEERFFEKVNKTDSCWLWTAALNSRDYGSFTYERKRMSAHRFSYMYFVGELVPGLFVCHSCDVRHCVNPAHLFLGSAQDNHDDMISKGRSAFAKGASQYQVKSHCKRGHDFSVVGYRYGRKRDGREWRTCKKCSDDSSRAYKARRRS